MHAAIPEMGTAINHRLSNLWMREKNAGALRDDNFVYVLGAS
jgi:hypothetical protein